MPLTLVVRLLSLACAAQVYKMDHYICSDLNYLHRQIGQSDLDLLPSLWSRTFRPT